MICTKKQNWNNRRFRSGSAPLEFVMSLPLLLLALLFIVVGAKLFLMRIHLAQLPRQTTFPARHGVPSGNLLSLSVDSNIGRLFGTAANAGLISDERLFGMTLPRRLGGYGVRLKESNSVMGGAWDHQLMHYGPRKPLQVNPTFSVYGGNGSQDMRTIRNGLARLGK